MQSGVIILIHTYVHVKVEKMDGKNLLEKIKLHMAALTLLIKK